MPTWIREDGVSDFGTAQDLNLANRENIEKLLTRETLTVCSHCDPTLWVFRFQNRSISTIHVEGSCIYHHKPQVLPFSYRPKKLQLLWLEQINPTTGIVGVSLI